NPSRARNERRLARLNRVRFEMERGDEVARLEVAGEVLQSHDLRWKHQGLHLAVERKVVGFAPVADAEHPVLVHRFPKTLELDLAQCFADPLGRPGLARSQKYLG